MLGDCLFCICHKFEFAFLHVSKFSPMSLWRKCRQCAWERVLWGGPVKPARAHRREIPDRAYGKRAHPRRCRFVASLDRLSDEQLRLVYEGLKSAATDGLGGLTEQQDQ